MKLIIAEKAIAAQRIANILGTPKKELKNRVQIFNLPDSVIVPLRGHIVNVDFPEKYKGWVGTALPLLIDSKIEYNLYFKNVGQTLEQYAKQVDTCIIATDFDREGESIGAEVLTIIKKANPKIKIKRAKFSALTKQEVGNAFNNLVEFDYNLADSADARREIDLIWGAVLTRFISIAAKRLGKSFLSVGRVQTPTLALIVDREKEIKAFNPEDFWEISIDCEKNTQQFRALHEKEKIFDKKVADELAKLTGDAALIKSVVKKEVILNPPEPFNTTSFLRAASAIGLQPSQAMSIAETLYTQGYISYPRTDNTYYPESIDLREIVDQFSQTGDFQELAKKLLQNKKLTPTHGKKKTTDHPPIHPVNVVLKSKLPAKEWKIYELIVRRFFATLAPIAKLDTIKAILDYSGENFIARGKTVKEKGWKEYYHYSKTKEEFIPELVVNENVKVLQLNCDQKQTKPPARYTPSALIKILDDLNLGTKSTRPVIIQKLVDRGYISGQKNYTPSEIAFVLIDALEKHADTVTKADMTAELEKEMDHIEEGKLKKEKVVDDSRKVLSEILQQLALNNNQISADLQKARLMEDALGKCPKCEKNLIIIKTKKGTRFVGCKGYLEGCDVSFPLPAKGKIVKLDNLCKDCNLPTIRVISGVKRYYDMCINHKCKSKAGWVRKKKD